MKRYTIYGVLIITLAILVSSFVVEVRRWGFFGHRRINRLAVFTLAPEMMPLFKNNIDFLTEHAVDPDKRRYAVRDEAIRHYIDLDHWGVGNFDHLPRHYPDVLIQYGDFKKLGIDSTFYLFNSKKIFSFAKNRFISYGSKIEVDTSNAIEYSKYRYLINTLVLHKLRYQDEAILTGSEINKVLNKYVADTTHSYIWVDTFSTHGILPYWVPDHYAKLVSAFRSKNHETILQLAADMGHYIGDAYVPLHTTSNYNGQLTNQYGLHAFWESRIPELFADKNYDYLVGKAQYIKNIDSYIWEIVLKSHALVDSVLSIEKKLSMTIPADQQYCFDERMGITVRTQCESYAKAYQIAMNGMVEQRMREAILAVGSVWYSAWIDAGQPNLSKIAKSKTFATPKDDDDVEKAFRGGLILGRPEN